MSTGLITGGGKIFACFFTAALACGTIPASFYFASMPQSRNEIKRVIGSHWNEAKNYFRETGNTLKGAYIQIKNDHFSEEAWSGRWDAIKTNLDYREKIEEYKGEIKKIDKDMIDKATNTAEEVNYYAWTYSNLIKKFANYIPKILEDSATERPSNLAYGRRLSITKIIAIVAAPDAENLFEALKWAFLDKADIVEKMTTDDSQRLMEFIAAVPYDYLQTWLAKVKENHTAMEADDEAVYDNACEFMADLLVGKDKSEEIKSQAAALKAMIEDESNLTLLKNALGLENASTEEAKQVIEKQIQQLTAILDKLQTSFSMNNKKMCEKKPEKPEGDGNPNTSDNDTVVTA